MGYTTQFEGKIDIEPPLSTEEIAYLRKFSTTRRMLRRNGPYFVDGSGSYGQGEDQDVLDYNTPPHGQPGLWCQWVPTDDGRALVWDEGGKFYHAKEWMTYLIEHFLSPTRLAPLPFMTGHTLNGDILAQGEDIDDRWRLIVIDNVVTRKDLD